MVDMVVLQKLITSIRNAIKNKNIDTSSAIKLVCISMEIMESFNINNDNKKQYVIMAIQEIAKGDDLIMGTADDTISPQVVESLIAMIHRNLISEIIDIICLASKGEFNLNKIKTTCFGCISIANKYNK
jgi:hypothetical protein